MLSFTPSRGFALCLLGLVTIPVLHPAATIAATPLHVRGTISSVDGTVVKIKTRDGRTVSFDLADGWSIGGIAKASMADIKPGTFIGTATTGETDSMKALEVVVFPEKMRGVGEGHYPWDLQPKSSMTNANVTHAVQGVDGQTVTLAYKGGEKTVTISADTPVVSVIDATPADLVADAPVFIATPAEQDGKLAKGFVAVGKGAVPPM